MDEYLSELKNKFGYDEDLLKAIELTIDLMIEEYGEESKIDIYSMFADVQIMTLNKIDYSTLEEFDKKLHSYNPHVIYENVSNPYECVAVASTYTYEPIYDADMHVMSEKRYIIVPDMKGLYNEDAYRKVFGTSINMPYFLHEANHAYAMMHPEYRYDVNKVIAKHGMYVTVYEFELGDDQKYRIKTTSTRGIILEDMINEKITQNMLVRLLKKQNYKEVKDVFSSIRHVESAYGPVIIAVGDLLEDQLGKDNLMDYRRNNNYDVITNFNQKAVQSDIALEYFGNLSAFDYLSNKVHDLFNISINKYKMKLNDYAYETAKTMVEALAPIAAFEEVEHHTTNLEKFNKRRDKVLASHSKNNNSELSN